MLNRGGRIWIDRLSEGLPDTRKRLSPGDGEGIVRLAAHHVGAEVHASAPRVSAELPETVERFQGLCRPWSRPRRSPSASPPPRCSPSTIMSATVRYRGAKPRHFGWASPPARKSSSLPGLRPPLAATAMVLTKDGSFQSAPGSFAVPIWILPCRQNWVAVAGRLLIAMDLPFHDLPDDVDALKAVVAAMGGEQPAKEAEMKAAAAEIARFEAVEKSANERIANLTSILEVCSAPNTASVPSDCALASMTNRRPLPSRKLRSAFPQSRASLITRPKTSRNEHHVRARILPLISEASGK